MSTYQITTEDFETVARYVSLAAAASYLGISPRQLSEQLREFGGIICHGRYVIENDYTPARRAKWYV